MADYYVAKSTPGASDGNSGTDANPWLSITYGAANISVGDTLHVSDGNYHMSDATIPYSTIDLTFNGQRETTNLTTTIKAKAGQTNVVLDGQFTYPNRSYTNKTDILSSWDPLVRISGKYIVWDGIDVVNSVGMAIQVLGNATQITVKNCTMSDTRESCVHVEDSPSYVTFDNCEFYRSGLLLPSLNRTQHDEWHDHPGMLTIKNGTYVTVSDSIFGNGWGEGILVDANHGYSSNITIEDNIFYDTYAPAIYVHAVSDCVVQRNFIYQSTTNRALSYPNGPMPMWAGINVRPRESQYTGSDAKTPSDGVKVVSNIVTNLRAGARDPNTGVSHASGIAVTENRSDQGAVIDVLVMNNTITNCLTGFNANAVNKQSCVFKNNIITDCTTSAQGGTEAQWSFDYNHWDSTPSIFSNPANDVTGAGVALVDATHQAAAGAGDPTRFGIGAGSTAAAAGDDLSTEYATTPAADTKDYWGSSRSAWDIGAHEAVAGHSQATVTVVPTPDPANIVAGGSVDFNSTVTGGTGPFNYDWEFPGGSPSTDNIDDPQDIVYSGSGQFTAKCTITDSVTGITDDVTETITVSAAGTGGGTAPVTVEQVIFDAGDASYTVSEAPSAIIFMYSLGEVDGTAYAHSAFGYGIYDVANDQGYGMGIFADNIVPTSNTSIGIKDGPAIFMPGVEESNLLTGTISSVTATTVSLSWSGLGAAVLTSKIISWNIYGPGVTNVLATSQYMGASNSNNALSGDYTHVFMPAVMRTVDSMFGTIDCSIGIAIKDGGQMCLAYGQSDNKTITETYSKLWTDMIAGFARTSGASIEVTSFTSSSVIFTPRGRDIMTGVPLLAMNISGADSYLAVEDTPITAASTDYTDAGFDSGVMMALLSNNVAVDTQDTGSSIFGIMTVDSANVDRTVMMSSKDAVGITVENSYTDAKYAVLDEDGAIASEGAATIITDGFNLTPTTADSTARKMITFLIEETADVTDGPTAAFTYSPLQPVYTDTIQFTDLSTSDGTHAITGWDWDWNDGTANGTTQNPTHVFASEGTKDVLLTVTDADSDTHSARWYIHVGIPDITVSFTVSPTSGDVPLTVTLDASASTAAGNEYIEEDATTWIIETQNYEEGVQGYRYEAQGIDIDVIIQEIGIWNVTCTIKTSSGDEESLIKDSAFNTPPDILADLQNQYDRAITTTGPFTANYSTDANTASPALFYEWDFGDGQYSDGWNSTDWESGGLNDDTPANVYAAHGAQYYMTFNGTTSEIDCGSDAALDDLHDGAFTVEAWVRANSLGENNTGYIMTKGGMWLLAMTSSGLYGAISCATTTGFAYAPPSDFSDDGLWHHVMMTWDDASYNYPRLWIDGVEPTYNSTQNRVGIVNSDAGNNLRIGNRWGNDRTWDGDIAWVRISNTILTTTSFTPPARHAPPKTAGTTVEQWDLNDGSGTTAVAKWDSTTNDGTITDGTWSAGEAVGTQDYLTFNGSTSMINCGSDAALDDLHDSAMTVEAWVKADSTGEGTLGHIVGKTGTGGTYGWKMYISPTGLQAVINCATDGEAVSTTSEFSADGEWHHVAFTWADSTYNYPHLWIDGVKSAYSSTQTRIGVVVTDVGDDVVIGNEYDGTRTWDGDIAWVRISDSILYADGYEYTPPSRFGPPESLSTTVEQWSLNDSDGVIAAAEEDTPTNDGTITDGAWTTLTENYVFDVTLGVSLTSTDLSGPPDDVVTKKGYITIAPISTPPLNLDELTAIAAEVAKHVGCLDDATWVVDGTYGNVYTATVSRKWASGYTYTVKEDAIDLSSQVSIAACQSVAGSYYVSYSDPNLVVSVHTTGTDDPTSNGSVYSLRFT